MQTYVAIFWVFFKISLLSFGGVFGVLPELEKMVVVDHGWITSDKFVQSYVISSFVPGPNMAMCSLIGFWVAGWLGFTAGFLGIYTGPLLVMGVVERFIEKRKNLSWVVKSEKALRPLVLGLVSSSALRYWYSQSKSLSPSASTAEQILPLGASLVLTILGIYLYSNKKAGAFQLIFGMGFCWWLLRVCLAL